MPLSLINRLRPCLLIGLLGMQSALADPALEGTVPAITRPESKPAASAPVSAPGFLPISGLPTLQIEDLAEGEGQSRTRAFSFIVRMSHPSANPVTVRYATASGTAKTGVDFVETAGTLTFMPGQTSKMITVQFKGDTVPEANETFTVRLFEASGAIVVDAHGLGVILNDDGPVLKINNVAELEGDTGLTRFNFTVSLSEKSQRRVTVYFATANGSAFAGSDYGAQKGLLFFSPGQTSKTVTIEVRGDRLKEINEEFFVSLSNADGASIFTNRGVGTIRNDDGPITLLVPPGRVSLLPAASPPPAALHPEEV